MQLHCRNEEESEILRYHSMTLKHIFYLLILSQIFFMPSHAYTTDDPKKYPDLDGTTWMGTDYDGKKYEITFHSDDYVHRSAVQPQDQGVLAGKASFVTDPNQKIKTCLYYFEGPAEQNHHDPDYRYKIRFEWPKTWAQMYGTLFDDQITMDNVEPRTVAIDPKLLFGKDFKSDQGLQGGVIVNDGDQVVSYQIEFYGDVEWAQRTIEMELLNGNPPKSGPSKLGNCSFYQNAWSEPSKAPVLSFVRNNVLIHVEAHAPDLESPQMMKSMLDVAYKLDSAICNEDSSVTIIRMPKTLNRK